MVSCFSLYSSCSVFPLFTGYLLFYRMVGIGMKCWWWWCFTHYTKCILPADRLTKRNIFIFVVATAVDNAIERTYPKNMLFLRRKTEAADRENREREKKVAINLLCFELIKRNHTGKQHLYSRKPIANKMKRNRQTDVDNVSILSLACENSF